jgi:hypothetical protein
MELGRQFKQPHEMSPDEFAAHPAAIFHSTYLPDDQIFDLSKRFPAPSSGEPVDVELPDGNSRQIDPKQKIHLGTFQAALDTGIQSYGNRTKGQKAKPVTVHTFWQTPKVSGSTAKHTLSMHIPDLTDWSAAKTENDPEAVAHYAAGSQYYSNQNEDTFNPSFATDDPKTYLTSQADYVKAALDRGVPESEIHPRTLKLYKAGTLGKMVLPLKVQKLMRDHEDKLGPLKAAGPKWDYLNSEEEAPKRPEI